MSRFDLSEINYCFTQCALVCEILVFPLSEINVTISSDVSPLICNVLICRRISLPLLIHVFFLEFHVLKKKKEKKVRMNLKIRF